MRLPGTGIGEVTAALCRVAALAAAFAGAAGPAGMPTRGTPVRMNPDARWCVVSWLSYRARQKRCSFRLDCCRRSSARGSARFCRNLSGEFCDHIEECDHCDDLSNLWRVEVRLRPFVASIRGSSGHARVRVRRCSSRAQLTAGWQEARAARHSFRHSSALVSLASSAARRSAAAASSRSRACSTLMLAWAALAASAVRRASRSCAAALSLSCRLVCYAQPHIAPA